MFDAVNILQCGEQLRDCLFDYCFNLSVVCFYLHVQFVIKQFACQLMSQFVHVHCVGAAFTVHE